LPSFLKDLYNDGACRQPKYLYDLRKLHEKKPTLVERRCAGTESINHTFMESLAAAVNASGTEHAPQKQDSKGKVERCGRTTATVAVGPGRTRRFSYQGRAGRILKIVAQFEDGAECEIEGDALDQCVWAAADDS
jgi:hypothetical protein